MRWMMCCRHRARHGGDVAFQFNGAAAALRRLRGLMVVAAVLPCVVATGDDSSALSAIFAQLRAARTFTNQGDFAAAKAEYAKLRDMPNVPDHLRREAEECAGEIERLQQGLPARDAKASRVQLPQRAAPALTFHVAPDGSDASPGTPQQPFATLERARDAIRAIKRTEGLPEGGVAVLVHDGEYKVAQTFTLTEEDSGTDEAPIVYCAAEKAKPVFSAGVRLRGFQPVRDQAILARLSDEVRRKVVQVDIKANGVTEITPLRLRGFGSGHSDKKEPAVELFFNGQAMPLARWPNEGFVCIEEVSVHDGPVLDGHFGKIQGSKVGRFRYSGDRPDRWKDDKDGLLYGYWFWNWADSYEPIASIDTVRREITLAEPYHVCGYRKGQPYYAVNLLSEIDMPGEWYLDRAAGILYFYPPSAPNEAAVQMSAAAFPLVEMKDVSHLSFENIGWELGGSDGVKITGGRQCLLAGCTIRHCAGDGATITDGAGHGILSCDIHSLGRGGTIVSGGDRKTLVAGGHFVENCHIYDLSRIDHTYTPAVLMYGVGNRISHNLMHDVRSSAIRLEGNEHLVELNESYRVVTESDDQGGIDMFRGPTFRGNVLRYNYWHHIGNWRQPSEGPWCGQAGIRLDDAICGTLIYGNVFYHCSTGMLGFGGVQINGGKENVIDNNVFVDCMAVVSFTPWGESRWNRLAVPSLDSPEIDRSLYLSRYPALSRLAENWDVNMVSRSIALRCGEFLRRDRGRTIQCDNLVTTDDPGFADAHAGQFALKADAPAAEKIGLRPIPFDEIGLYGDEFRRELPKETVREARALTAEAANSP